MTMFMVDNANIDALQSSVCSNGLAVRRCGASALAWVLSFPPLILLSVCACIHSLRPLIWFRYPL